MILYLIHDLQQKTYSHPLVGPDLKTINLSLKQLNPENLSDLKVVVLDTLETLDDLLNLRISNKNSHISDARVVKTKLKKSLKKIT